MSTSLDLKSLESQALSAIESGDAADEEHFRTATGLKATEFRKLLHDKGPEHAALAVQSHQEMSRGATTPARMAYAMSKLCKLDAETFAYQTGKVVVTNSHDPAYAAAHGLARLGAMAHYLSNEQHPDFSGTMVFFQDRIPAGIEERVILREMYQNLSRRKDGSGLDFLIEAVARWEHWGGHSGIDGPSTTERDIFLATEKKVDDLRRMRWLLRTQDESRFVFAAQEAIKRGITPDPKGSEASGWLHEVFEHAKYTLHSTLGIDLPDMTPVQLLELIRFDDPFKRECENMQNFLRDERQKAEEMAEQERLAALRVIPPEMEMSDKGWPVSRTVLAFYESGDPVLVVFECPDEDNLDEVRITTTNGYDVTGQIVDWVEVPERPERSVTNEHSRDDSPSLGM